MRTDALETRRSMNWLYVARRQSLLRLFDIKTPTHVCPGYLKHLVIYEECNIWYAEGAGGNFKSLQWETGLCYITAQSAFHLRYIPTPVRDAGTLFTAKKRNNSSRIAVHFVKTSFCKFVSFFYFLKSNLVCFYTTVPITVTALQMGGDEWFSGHNSGAIYFLAFKNNCLDSCAFGLKNKSLMRNAGH